MSTARREQRNVRSSASQKVGRRQTTVERSLRWSALSFAFKLPQERIIGLADKFRANPQASACEFLRMPAHEQSVSAERAHSHMTIHAREISAPCMFLL